MINFTRLSPFPFNFSFARGESLGTRLHLGYTHQSLNIQKFSKSIFLCSYGAGNSGDTNSRYIYKNQSLHCNVFSSENIFLHPVFFPHSTQVLLLVFQRHRVVMNVSADTVHYQYPFPMSQGFISCLVIRLQEGFPNIDMKKQLNNTHREIVAEVQTRMTSERIFSKGAPTSKEQASQTFHQDDTIILYVNSSPIPLVNDNSTH